MVGFPVHSRRREEKKNRNDEMEKQRRSKTKKMVPVLYGYQVRVLYCKRYREEKKQSLPNCKSWLTRRRGITVIIITVRSTSI